MKKRVNMNKGKLFIIVGVFLILISLTMTFYNKYEDLNAGKQARAALDVFKNEVVVQNHIVESLTTEEVKEMKTVNINGDDFIGTITIPSINLELPVMSEYSYSRLKKAPCRYYGNLFTNDLIICCPRIRHDMHQFTFCISAEDVRTCPSKSATYSFIGA